MLCNYKVIKMITKIDTLISDYFPLANNEIFYFRNAICMRKMWVKISGYIDVIIY